MAKYTEKKRYVTVPLWISEEVLNWVEDKAEEREVSPDQIVSECIKKSIKREINARQKREEYHKKKAEALKKEDDSA